MFLFLSYSDSETVYGSDEDNGIAVHDFSDDSVADPDYDPSIGSNKDNQDSLNFINSDEEMPGEVEAEAERVVQEIQLPVKRQRQQNIKYKRLSKEEKVVRDKTKHPLGPPCSEKCGKQCTSSFTADERLELWHKYWAQDYCLRRKWLAKNVEIRSVARRTVPANNDNGFAKNDSRKFYLPKANRSVCVCRNFFLNTLGYSNDSVITALCTAIKNKPLLVAVKENRGTTGNYKRAKNRTLVMNHINKYKPCVTHYRFNNLTRFNNTFNV